MDHLSLVGIVPWEFVAQIANLLIQAALFKKFLFKPVQGIIAKRRGEVNAIYGEAEAARTAAVFELRGVDDTVGAALRVGLLGVDAPQVGQALVKCGAHGLGLARILVIDNHDAPRRGRELGHGVEQVGQEFLALVRNDDDGELVDGGGKG